MSYIYSSFNTTSGSEYANFCQMADWLKEYLGLFFSTVTYSYSYPLSDDAEVVTESTEEEEEETEEEEEETEEEEEEEEETEEPLSSNPYIAGLDENGYGVMFSFDSDTPLYITMTMYTKLTPEGIYTGDMSYLNSSSYSNVAYYGVASDYGIMLTFSKMQIIIAKTYLGYTTVTLGKQSSSGGAKSTYIYTLDSFNEQPWVSTSANIQPFYVAPMTVMVPIPLQSDDYILGQYIEVCDENGYGSSLTNIYLYAVNDEVFASMENGSTTSNYSVMCLKC